MNSFLKINNVDVYQTYGVAILQNGGNSLFENPPLKPVHTTVWQEEDGIDVDLSNPVIDKHTLTLQCYCKKANTLEVFLDMLTKNTYSTFEIQSCNILKNLRYVKSNITDVSIIGNEPCIFTMTLIDDMPYTQNQEPSVPVFPTNYKKFPSTNVYIDEFNLDRLNICPIFGTIKELFGPAEVRSKMYIDSKYTKGALYDKDAPITYKSRKLKIPCLLKCPSTMFNNINNYLLYLLTTANNKILRFPTPFLGTYSIDFYYDSTRVNEVTILDNSIIVDFTLHIKTL